MFRQLDIDEFCISSPAYKHGHKVVHTSAPFYRRHDGRLLQSALSLFRSTEMRQNLWDHDGGGGGGELTTADGSRPASNRLISLTPRTASHPSDMRDSRTTGILSMSLQDHAQDPGRLKDSRRSQTCVHSLRPQTTARCTFPQRQAIAFSPFPHYESIRLRKTRKSESHDSLSFPSQRLQ